MLSQLANNGPAIKAVCVTRRTEAVGCNVATGQSPGTAEGASMARFLVSWYKL